MKPYEAIPLNECKIIEDVTNEISSIEEESKQFEIIFIFFLINSTKVYLNSFEIFFLWINLKPSLLDQTKKIKK